jgi:hypothetical protein
MFAYAQKEGLITSIVQAGRKWRVRVAGTEWFAAQVENAAALAIGDMVQVVGLVNATTLLVKRLSQPE